MGTVLINTESIKIEYSIILFIITGVVIHFFVKYSIVNLDAIAFVIFAAMCFAGYFALKTAKEIITIINENRQAAYETLKSANYFESKRDIVPIAFQNHLSHSKYVTSTNIKNKW